MTNIYLPFTEDVETRKQRIKEAFAELWLSKYSKTRRIVNFALTLMELGSSKQEAIEKALDTLKYHPDYIGEVETNQLEGLVRSKITEQSRIITQINLKKALEELASYK